MKKYLKTIALLAMLIIEGIITFLSLKNDWNSNISIALIFLAVLLFYNGLQSFVDKFDNEHSEMVDKNTKEHDEIKDVLNKNKTETMEQLSKEHNEIKGMVELYGDIQELSYLALFETNYVETQSGKDDDVEIWIISNDVAESDPIIDKMYHNIDSGVQYFYVIPKVESCVNDLRKTVKKLRKKSKKDKGLPMLRYIQDDLFDLMPSNYIDFVFYCNPSSTDYKTNMKVFYCLQKTNSGIFYKPAKLTEPDIHRYFETMERWKEKQWNEL